MRLSRLPLRVRLVAGFSAATIVVLLAAGWFIYWRVEDALDRDLDTELGQAILTLDPLVQADGSVHDPSAAAATGVAWQILDSRAGVLAYGGPAPSTALVPAATLEDVGARPRTLDLGHLLPISHAPYRVQVVATAAEPTHYLLVGVRRDHRDEALRELLVQLVSAGLGILVISAFVGDRLARAALRPVERYRRQAAAIAGGAAEMRLDVPTDRDDEVTRLGHTFNDMLAALERALERERQFVNEASHELRTPLTLLTSRIQLARRRSRTQEEHERILGELQVDLDRLAGLADQLLDLGRTAARPGSSTTNLGAVASRVVEQRRVADPGRAADLSLVVPGQAVMIPLSDSEAERLLTNLIDNATTHGAPPIEITVDRPVSGWVRLVVTDAGAGMPSELLATATQRFTRADEARPRPGSGLGLALVEVIVAQAGGELRLCHADEHASHGSPAPVPCGHGAAMTVTALLPEPRDPVPSAAHPG